MKIDRQSLEVEMIRKGFTYDGFGEKIGLKTHETLRFMDNLDMGREIPLDMAARVCEALDVDPAAIVMWKNEDFRGPRHG